jgi:hypothetical protein
LRAARLARQRLAKRVTSLASGRDRINLDSSAGQAFPTRYRFPVPNNKKLSRRNRVA